MPISKGESDKRQQFSLHLSQIFFYFRWHLVVFFNTFGFL